MIFKNFASLGLGLMFLSLCGGKYLDFILTKEFFTLRPLRLCGEYLLFSKNLSGIQYPPWIKDLFDSLHG
jgi:hypothetical protein